MDTVGTPRGDAQVKPAEGVARGGGLALLHFENEPGKEIVRPVAKKGGASVTAVETNPKAKSNPLDVRIEK